VLVVGVVNVTPDSFFDGGRHASTEAALVHALALAEAGADWLDVGGESTRPGAEPVPEREELKRVLPVIEALAKECPLRWWIRARAGGRGGGRAAPAS
jgi:dihydropteroate synthase